VTVIIRCGAMGAYRYTCGKEGRWVEAFWTERNQERVVDVTGAGNAFLGGLSAGLHLNSGNIDQAMFYGAVSASFTVEQFGLPKLVESEGEDETWNGDLPSQRLAALMDRHVVDNKCD